MHTPRRCAIGSHVSTKDVNGRQTTKVLESLKLTSAKRMLGDLEQKREKQSEVVLLVNSV